MIRNRPNTWPRPLVVSTRLQARIVIAPLSRGSELVAVPVYVALVASNVSPPLTEHVTWYFCETVAASKVALVACRDGCLNALAVATPAAASAATTGSANSKSRFLDIWCRLGSKVDRSLTGP
jgi:hypothetical protein